MKLGYMDPLLAVPSAVADLATVHGAAVEAVEDFQRREAASGPLAAEEPTSSDSSAASTHDNGGPLTTSEPPAHGVLDDSDMFRLDLFREIDLGSYYMSLAEALLKDPPPLATSNSSSWDNGDCGDGAADFSLWSY
ncbi:dehydration-responsive element-binding protein 1H-like [Lolium perenne]|uniref:dehydration-responsive element-binding protein 1H-like n=1 Tax=Lolium perenne TaxID=4522 RepID=UPI0021F6230F|nr:dehydration-responsive element-binding protein 1H-like [Lolium perenne]